MFYKRYNTIGDKKMIRRLYKIMGKHELTRKETLEFLENTEKEFKYTHGLEFRGPATYRVPITRKEAIKIFEEDYSCDVEEYEEYIHLNTYGDSDFW